MNFEYLIKSCEIESERVKEKNFVYLSMIIDKLGEYINKQIKENSSQGIADVNDKIVENVKNYLSSINESKFFNKTVEYYLNRMAYTGKTDIRKIYDKVYREERAGKIDLTHVLDEDFNYGYNMEENMEKLIKIIVKGIRVQKEELERIEDVEYIMYELRAKNSKDRATYINKILQSQNLTEQQKRETKEQLEKGFKLYFKSERELVEETVKEYTESAGRVVKEDCIKCISKSTQFLDEIGLLEHFTKLNNKNYQKVYMNNVKFSYDQVKQLLSEENLKKLNAEELIIMTSFWTNRVNKVIKDLSKALYIFNHDELIHKETESEDGVTYSIKRADMKNIDLKMNVIHKLFFELYSDLDDEKSKKNVKNISRYVKGIASKHKNEYKEYFDKIFPESENSLKDDMFISHIFENVRYNSYKIKAYGIQALLVSLFNSNSKNIENFGYIPESEAKKEILIAADVKGYNMTFALHTNKNLVLDFLKNSQGNTLIQVYKCYDDFELGKDDILKAQILVPIPKEIDKEIEIAYGRITDRDRYGKTVKHLNYLRKTGKMPEHLMEPQGTAKNRKYKYVREYVDLSGDGKKLERDGKQLERDGKKLEKGR
ncbi:MAG: hypothetical protein IKD77_04200 [Bacilli bacterium]|nr:hypothetical protein [Bacilli bacterium]